ncbi:MAG: hypothetical protein ACTSO3_16735 [Candidatus Heimdallarchaeaceae archaeon]
MLIKYNGREVSINEHLLDKQDVWKNLKDILDIRIGIASLLDYEEILCEDKELNKENAKQILEELTEMEYKLQDFWGFDRDKNFHTYVLQLAGCLCPSLDNRELLGLERRWISEDCPYHSILEQEGL